MQSRPRNYIYRSLRQLAGLLLLIWTCNPLLAQKYNFINFNVENGLVQSQAKCFTQNANNELLIGTYGGLSVFDGTNFTNYNKSKGLSHNVVYALARDKAQNIWLGTSNGISRFDGKDFRSYYPLGVAGENLVNQLLVDGHNNVWALLSNRKLYRFNGIKFVEEASVDSSFCMTLDRSGKLWVACQDDGIRVFDGKSWHKEIDLGHEPQLIIYQMSFGGYSGTLYCLSTRGILYADRDSLRSPGFVENLPPKGFPDNILEDSRGTIWLSYNDGGAWVFQQDKWSHYVYKNGLTDDNVDQFFEDAEGNIWIATNGSGIYQYNGSLFTYYDRGTGLLTPSVMSIAQRKNDRIYFGSNSSGLYELINGVPHKVDLPPIVSRINTLVTDSTDHLWIGTNNVGLWKYNGQQAQVFRPSIEQRVFGITHLHRFGPTIWVSARPGLFRLEGDSLYKEPVSLGYVYVSHALNRDSLLIGTMKGVYLYRSDIQQLQEEPILANANILCFESDAQYAYFGTDDRGVVAWNIRDGSMRVIGDEQGLSCDYAYSMLNDRKGNIWVGTGCGIDRITMGSNSVQVKSFGKADGLLGVENNANACFEDRQGFLWFGTTRGVFRYNPYVSSSKQNAPKVIIQSVKLYSKEIPPGKYADSTQPFTGHPWNPVFPTNQNHLTFSFKGVYLSNPDKIRYRYQLVGIDKSFTETNQTTVVYPNLPPGEYLFKVWASDADGNWYNNAVTYPFIINTPYYTTWYFRLGMGLLLMGIFLGAVYYRNRQKELRRRWKDKLREEEQALVRKKTAEDFHDEIGNKLTRINLLATIAERKLQQPEADVRPILQQIQNNVSSLYEGSKDIIWSLQPDSDFLDEIVFRIKQNTTDLLQGTDIQFSYSQSADIDIHIKLPVDHSRNLIMIFKEAVNNIVKHAGAKHIYLSLSRPEDQIIFELRDDGRGFDTNQHRNGNGMGNMYNRANRIGANLIINSTTGAGTCLRLHLNI